MINDTHPIRFLIPYSKFSRSDDHFAAFIYISSINLYIRKPPRSIFSTSLKFVFFKRFIAWAILPVVLKTICVKLFLLQWRVLSILAKMTVGSISKLIRMAVGISTTMRKDIFYTSNNINIQKIIKSIY